MATCEKPAGSSSSAGLCCPVCYREYSDSESDLIPRILHCGHTYCTECLQRLLEVEGEGRGGGWRELEDLFGFLSSSGTRSNLQLPASPWGRGVLQRRSHAPADEVTCPVCKSSNHVQGGEVASLTKNFALLGMQEGGERGVGDSRHYCQEHDHEQRIYCRDCQLLVCAYCQLYGRHKDHECLIAAEACRPAVEEVRRLQREVEEELQGLEVGEAAVLASVQRLEHGRDRSERRISCYYDQLVEALQQRRAAEVERLCAWADEQAYVLQAQLRSLSGARKACSRLVEDCRRIADRDPLQALSEKASLTSRADAATTSIAGLPHDPIITPSIRSHRRPGTPQHLQALFDGISVDMSLDAASPSPSPSPSPPPLEGLGMSLEEGNLASSTELSGPLLHAQDTQHSAEQAGLDCSTGLPRLDSVDPSPSLASPASYSTTSLYLTHHYTPTSSNSEDEDSAGGDEFKVLQLRQPLSFLMVPPALHYSAGQASHRFSHDEAAELADDEEELEVGGLLGRSPPSPPSSLSVPSIPPATGLLTSSYTQAGEERQTVSLSIAGQGVHISVSGSAWPPMAMPPLSAFRPPMLLDSDDRMLAEDSD